ncbi:hypothetical protein M407DRAFT_243535 [Tulasnella calospora MUT 4182]|uniref:Uncharacterized protein n=1 Tax=Tulasnella calospora MUT 4182 TaxID=1051891 RepID=A0A0C3LZS6_9AGAM|nr:hypothetical protein M407DRAFT_243535 [Tulasnella calospora MUT 4182]
MLYDSRTNGPSLDAYSKVDLKGAVVYQNKKIMSGREYLSTIITTDDLLPGEDKQDGGKKIKIWSHMRGGQRAEEI